MKLIFTNNAQSDLAASISSAATTMLLSSGDGPMFPAPAAGEGFHLTISTPDLSIWEIVLVTGRTGDAITTMQRGQEGTTARSWGAGSIIMHRGTAADFGAMAQEATLLSGAPYTATAGGTANALTATIRTSLTTLPAVMPCTIIASAANTGSAALVVTLGSTAQSSHPIVKFDNSPLDAGDIPASGYPIDLIYISAWSAFVILNPFNRVGSKQSVVSATAADSTIYSIPIGKLGSLFKLYGPDSFYTNLPTGSPSGGVIEIWNSSGQFQTVNGNGANISGPDGFGGSSVVMEPGSVMSFVFDGSQWNLLTLKHKRAISASLIRAVGVNYQNTNKNEMEVYATTAINDNTDGWRAFVSGVEICSFKPGSGNFGTMTFSVPSGESYYMETIGVGAGNATTILVRELV